MTGLIGTMRLCRSMGLSPRRYAFGAAAALEYLDDSANCALVLPILWQPDNPDPAEEEAMLALVQEGQAQLQRWRDGGLRQCRSVVRMIQGRLPRC